MTDTTHVIMFQNAHGEELDLDAMARGYYRPLYNRLPWNSLKGEGEEHLRQRLSDIQQTYDRYVFFVVPVGWDPPFRNDPGCTHLHPQ